MTILQNNLNKIRFFSKAHKDLGIFSSSFFNHVIVPIYKNTDELYTLVYIDLDETDSYNNCYGYNYCNIAIHNSLEIIKNNLPPNSVFSRIGGDEYIILLNDLDENKAKTMLKSIRKKLSHTSNTTTIMESQGVKKECPTCLLMSYGICDSKTKNSFHDIYVEAENREEFYKLEEDISDDCDDILSHKINHNFKKFFNNFRFSNKVEITPDIIRIIANQSISSAISMISNPEYLKNVKNRTSKEKRKATVNPIFNYKEASLLYNYVTDRQLTSNFLTNEKLDEFLTILVRNPTTGLLNKDYFYSFFVPNYKGLPNKDYSLLLTSICGMKNCNRKLTHNGTNEFLKKYANASKSNSDIPFNDNNFDTSPLDNYIFDLGGGKIFTLLSDNSLSDEDFKRMTDFSKIPDSPLEVFSSYRKSDSNNLGQNFNNLLDESSEIEKKYKLRLLESGEVGEDLEEFMLDFIEYYLDTSTNSHKEFLEQMLLSLVEQGSYFYKQQSKNCNTDKLSHIKLDDEPML